jgi:hypothetical protein
VKKYAPNGNVIRLSFFLHAQAEGFFRHAQAEGFFRHA